MPDKLIKCTIKTPQFKDNEVHYWHTQTGIFDTRDSLFTPSNWPAGPKKGDHPVQFKSIEDFNKYKVG